MTRVVTNLFGIFWMLLLFWVKLFRSKSVNEWLNDFCLARHSSLQNADIISTQNVLLHGPKVFHISSEIWWWRSVGNHCRNLSTIWLLVYRLFIFLHFDRSTEREQRFVPFVFLASTAKPIILLLKRKKKYEVAKISLTEICISLLSISVKWGRKSSFCRQNQNGSSDLIQCNAIQSNAHINRIWSYMTYSSRLKVWNMNDIALQLCLYSNWNGVKLIEKSNGIAAVIHQAMK